MRVDHASGVVSDEADEHQAAQVSGLRGAPAVLGLWSFCEEIAERSIQLQPYGLVVTWRGRERGCNPVWYLDITPGHTWLRNAVNELVALAEHEGARQWDHVAGIGAGTALEDAPILRLTPFIEQMGSKNDGGHKEFWWERSGVPVGIFT
jgi:hypothetical protein